jgi:hypothetical protein
MQVDEVILVIETVREQFQHEEDQGLMQERPDKAKEAMAGKFACERIARAVRARFVGQVVPLREARRAR